MSASAFRSACHSWQTSAGVPTASGSAPREAPPLAPGQEISPGLVSPPTPPAGPFLEVSSSSALPTCACGCGEVTKIAKKTDARTGAVKGEYQRFVRGHAGRPHRLEFADITAAWFDAHVTIGIAKGCWIADPVTVTIGGCRVRMAHIALLLSEGLPVTAKAISALRVRSRCQKRKCIRPDHMLTFDGEPAEDLLRRAAAIEHARARWAAFKAERTKVAFH